MSNCLNLRDDLKCMELYDEQCYFGIEKYILNEVFSCHIALLKGNLDEGNLKSLDSLERL